MPHGNSRKVFLVVAGGGNPPAHRHFEDTIQPKRNLEEVRRFLPSREIENLERIYHGSDFIVWGAVAGPMNESRWEKMAPGDVVLIYNTGRTSFAGIRVYVSHHVRGLDLDPAAAGFHVVSGHSHQPGKFERDDVPYINPGSAGPRRF